MKTTTRKPAVRQRFRRLPLLCAILLPAAAFAGTPGPVASDAIKLPAGALMSGATDAKRLITVAMLLPLSDPAGAQWFASHVSKPGDPLFRHYLKPADFAARFGANAQDYATLVAWARAQGLTPGEGYSSRTVLPVTGTTAAIEAAFNVKFSDFQDKHGATFYSANRAAKLPQALAGKITNVIGLSSANHFKPMAHIKPANMTSMTAANGPAGGYSAADLRGLYSVPAQIGPTGTQTLAVFEQGGFFQTDVNKYLTENKLPKVPVVVRNVNGYGGGVDDPNVEIEAVLDIDMQIAMNPAAKQILVYEDGADAFSVALVNCLSAMASDGTATSISVSYGMDEDYVEPASFAAENAILTQLAAQGQAVFVSSGDLGAYGDAPPGLHVPDPSSQPWVTAVGGTTLLTNAKHTINVEQVWNALGEGLGATGGGVSTVWPIPDYQMVDGQPYAPRNGGSATMRNTPDVAAVGDPLTGVDVYSNLNGGWITIGGTSVAAPIWAGVYSLGNAASELLGFGTAGFANPGLYRLGSIGGYFNPDFYDIFDGNNGNELEYGAPGFSAGYGYDNASGWGAMFALTLVPDIALLPALNGTHPPPPAKTLKAVASGTSVKLSWVGPPAATGYLVQGVNFTTGVSVAPMLAGKATTTAAITGLTPNTFYEFAVTAISTGGATGTAPIIVSTLKK
jgi:subtilase family serine protease